MSIRKSLIGSLSSSDAAKFDRTPHPPDLPHHTPGDIIIYTMQGILESIRNGGRERTRTILLLIIAGTIPCYCLGLIVLWGTRLTIGGRGITATPTLTETPTLELSPTPITFTPTLTYTPTITFTPTNTRTPFMTPTRTITQTFTEIPTFTATIVSTLTSVPPTATYTPVPLTETPSQVPSETPTGTATTPP